MRRRFATAILLLPYFMAAQAIAPAGYRYVGKLKPRSTREIKSSNWILGCETLDRGMTYFEQYKEYLAPLGVKRIRLLQALDPAAREKIRKQCDTAGDPALPLRAEQPLSGRLQGELK